MPINFILPELGENITAGDVLRVLVKPGDILAKDQAVLELETDKATIEVPSSVAGTVASVAVKAGEKVKVGQVVLTVDADAASTGDKKTVAAAPAPAPAPAPSTPAVAANTASIMPDNEAPEPPPAAPVAASAGAGPVSPPARTPDNVVDINRGVRHVAEPASPDTPLAPAAPSVRRLARELGVDINEVPGTGSEGRISLEDVKEYTRGVVGGSARAGGGIAAAPLPDFSKWGAIDRQPMRAVRRKTAEHLSAAWATIPHVTQHELADITEIEELRKKYAKQAEAAGGALTVTAMAVKVVATALKLFPQFNASIDLAAEEVIYKKYVNIGIAVDTDRGLLVPVIRNADTKNILQLAAEIAQLSEKARSRKITVEDMQGGCFSISNLGGLGGTYFTPIVNAPEVAILGISRGRIQPVFKDGGFVPRQMLPLSLSYDHRAIDGADGMRFLRWVADALEQPFLLALQG
jgi:pyruvate dehydrogenase E2 component (dihydrolipoamide acetyltransferase)